MLVVALWVVGLVLIGWAVARWGWRLGSADVAWGVAPAVGLAVGLVAANALAYIVPAGWAAGLGTGAARAGRGRLAMAATRGGYLRTGRPTRSGARRWTPRTCSSGWSPGWR